MSLPSVDSSTADASAPTPSAEDLRGQILSQNPFLQNRVTQPESPTPDVGSIHQREFERLTALAEQSREEQTGIGVLLSGEAGVGKSHLLGRLSRWCTERRGCYIYLQNLQAAPSGLARSILRTTISVLSKGHAQGWRRTPLFRLVNAAVRQALNDPSRRSATTFAARRAYQKMLDDLHRQGPAYQVLWHFFESAYFLHEDRERENRLRLAVRWLSGDWLDVEDLKQLGIDGERQTADGSTLDDLQVCQVFEALGEFAKYREVPFLLCLDQVDTLYEDQVRALSGLLHSLLDSRTNLLIVTSGVRETFSRWRTQNWIASSAWDRLAQVEVAVARIGADQAQEIVENRLDKYFAPYVELSDYIVSRQQDRLFPLGQPWIQNHLRDEHGQRRLDIRPRDVISWARTDWEAQQDALRTSTWASWLENWQRTTTTTPEHAEVVNPLELIDRKVELRMAEQKQLRLLNPEQLPTDAANLAGLVTTLLRQCLHAPRTYDLQAVHEVKPTRSSKAPAFDIVLEHHVADQGGVSRTGVKFHASDSATTGTTALRNILNEIKGSTETNRVILVTDERQPLKRGTAGDAYLRELTDLAAWRFEHVELTFDQYADLDALQAVISLTGSGDFEIESPGAAPRPLAANEIIASHHRRNRYAAHELLAKLLGAPQTHSLVSNRPPVAEAFRNQLRELIMAKLSLNPGISKAGLTEHCVYAGSQQPNAPMNDTVLKSQIEDVIQELIREGKIHSSPDCELLSIQP